DRVPVVRGADLDGIDVISAQDFAVIDVSFAAAIAGVAPLRCIVSLDQPPGRLPAADLPFPVARALAVDVADRHDSNPVVPQERADVVEPLVARADDRQIDAVARCDGPR